MPAFNRYICYINPAATRHAGAEQLVEVKYARARTYFEAQHWEEAAIGVPRHRDEQLRQRRRASTRRSSISRASTSSRHARLDDATAGPRTLLRRHGDRRSEVHRALLPATSPRRTRSSARSLNKIQVDILRLKAQKLVEIADKQGGTEALRQYEQAGNAYFELYPQVLRDADRATASSRRPRSATRSSTTPRRRSRRRVSSQRRSPRA